MVIKSATFAREVPRIIRSTTITLAVLGLLLQSWMVPELLAQELEQSRREQAIAQVQRERRIYVDERLPIGRQHDLVKRKLVYAGRMALRSVEDDQKREQVVGDLLALGERMNRIRDSYIIQFTLIRTRLIETLAVDAVLAHHDAFVDQTMQHFIEVARMVDAIRRSTGHSGRLVQRVTDLINYLEPPHDDDTAESLPRRRAAVTAERPGMPPFFEWPWRYAAGDGVIDQFLQQLSGLQGVAVHGDVEAADTQPALPEIEFDVDAITDPHTNDPIIQKARELNFNAVKIYEFVRNEVAYEPYFGSVKGARQTLTEMAGNDMDIASLLIAMLRVSGVPCRYTFGVIELSTDEAAKWVGVDDPAQVVKVFAGNGVPVEESVTEAGEAQVSRIRIGHTWVKMFADIYPYRAAADADQSQGDAWVEVDASFKQHAFTARQQLENRVGLDPRTLFSNVFSQATKGDINDDSVLDWATRLPESLIADELVGRSGPIREYLAANNLTTTSVFRSRIVAEERYGILPISDQYQIHSRGMSFRVLPQPLRHKLTLRLINPDGTVALNANEIDLPQIINKQIVLAYPLTTEQRAIVNAYADHTQFPAYLLANLQPQLRIGGYVDGEYQVLQDIAGSTTVGMGQLQRLEITFIAPDGTEEGKIERVVHEIAAGGYHTLILNAQNVVARQIAEHVGNMGGSAGSGWSDARKLDATLGAALHGIGLSYFHQIDRFNQITAASLGVSITRVPSLVRLSWDLEISNVLTGLPDYAEAGRVRVDIARDVYVPVSLARENRSAENQFLFTAALTSSALEHNVLMQAFPGSSAASVVRMIEAANRYVAPQTSDEMPIYTVTPNNVEDVIDALFTAGMPSSVLQTVTAAVNARQEVTIPQSSVTINDVPYIAYLRRDIDTSASDLVLVNLEGIGAGGFGGEARNDTLRSADLLRFNSDDPYFDVKTSTRSWLRVVVDATTNAGLAYLPAITHINAWYANRTDLDPVTTVAAALAVSSPITRVTEQPGILNVALTPSTGWVNNTGGSMAIAADVTRGATWSAKIYKENDTSAFATVNGTNPELIAAFSSFASNGDDDGLYRYELTAQAGEQAAMPVRGQFRVDRTIPGGTITLVDSFPTPEDTQPHNHKAIMGFADDLNFVSYEIQITDSADQTVTVAHSTQPIPAETTLFMVETSQFANGEATARLMVRDKAGNQKISEREFTINNRIFDDEKPVIDSLAMLDGSEELITSSSAPVTGVITASAAASDTLPGDAPGTLKKLQFYLDGNLLTQVDQDPEAEDQHLLSLENVQINTAGLRDGAHTLLARAVDGNGNLSELTPVSIRAFFTSNPISNFRVEPQVVTSSNPVLHITGNLKESSAWTLTFKHVNDTPVPTVHFLTNTSQPVVMVAGGTIDNSPQSPGLRITGGPDTVVRVSLPLTKSDGTPLIGDDAYVVTLDTVIDGHALQASAEFAVNLVDRPLVASIGNVRRVDPADPKDSVPMIVDGFFTLKGTANDADSADDVFYKIELVDTAYPFAVLKNLTAGASGGSAQGWVNRRVTNNVLHELDLTMVENGSYDLRLTAANSPEAEVETHAVDQVRFVLDSQLKIGQMTFSQQDMVLPVNGIPITLIRTYDSQRLAHSRDFGIGWSYAIGDINLKVDEDRLSAGESAAYVIDTFEGGPIELRTGHHFQRNVTLTLPDGRRATFLFTLVRDESTPPGAPTLLYRAKYVSPPGVRETLETDRPERLKVLPLVPPHWEHAGPGVPMGFYDFPGFVLVGADGTRFHIRRESTGTAFLNTASFGSTLVTGYKGGYLDSIQSRDGHRLQFNRDGSQLTVQRIDHVNPQGEVTKSLLLRRVGDDASQPIRAVYGPSHQTGGTATGPADFIYVYNTDDDVSFQGLTLDAHDLTYGDDEQAYPTDAGLAGAKLVAVLQLVRMDDETPVYETTRYYYYDQANRDHGNMSDPLFPGHVKSIKDARGITPIISRYDDQGRLTGTVDAHGNEVRLSHDIAGRREVVFDRESRATVWTYDTRGNVTALTDSLGFTKTLAYDGSNNVTRETDELGRTTSYEYDARGNRTSVTDPTGAVTRFTYDAYGNQLTVTDALGRTTSSTYDATGNLLTTTNARGETVKNVYASGNLTQILDKHNLVSASFGYSGGGGQLTSMTDASGNVRTFTYDSAGNQTQSYSDWTPPEGGSATRRLKSHNIYDAAGRVIETQQIEVDLTTSDETVVTVSTTQYNAAGHAVQSSDRLGNTTVHTYDARGNLIQSAFFEPGQDVEEDDPVALSRTVYDRNGRVIYSMDRYDPSLPNAPPGPGANYPLGTQTVYDAVGRVVESKRLSQVQIELITDPQHPSEKITRFITGSVISTHRTQYDPTGQVRSTTDALGVTTRYEYDAAGRQTQVTTDPGTPGSLIDDVITCYEYDAAGQQVSVTDALNRKTRFEYDALGRMTRTIYPDGTFTFTEHDDPTFTSGGTSGGGRREIQTDQAGRKKRYEYDSLGRLVAVQLPAVADPHNGNTLTAPRYEYAYDAYGNQLSITDALGRVTNFAYDHLNRKVSRTLPKRNISDTNIYEETWEYEDDPDEPGYGQLVKHTDFNGNYTIYEYDSLGRLEYKKLYAVGDTLTRTVKLVYDDEHYTPDVHEWDGAEDGEPDRATTYTFDSEGRVTQIQSPEGTVGYEYDVHGRRTAVKAGTTSRAQYTYDPLGRLDEVQQVKRNSSDLITPEVTTYAYNKLGMRESITLPNGVRTLYEFDTLNRLTRVKNAKFSSGVEQELLSQYDYTLGVDGQRVAVKDIRRESNGQLSTVNIAYTYDALNRLVSESSALDTNSATTREDAAFTHSYTYDLVGNRLQKQIIGGHATTYVYNGRDELTSETINSIATDYTYNTNGFMTGKMTSGGTSGGGESYAFTPDVEDRLAQVTMTREEDSSVVAVTVNYRYNHEGIRVRATQSAFTIDTVDQTLSDKRFLIDALNPTGYAQVLEERDGSGDPQLTYTLGDDVLSQADGSGTVRHLIYDGHGSTRQLERLHPIRSAFGAC